jgi:hypothetical protein
MGEWRVQLKGNNQDLKALEIIFSGTDIQIIEENDQLFLKSKEWDHIQEAGQVYDNAKRFVLYLDHASYLYNRDALQLIVEKIIKIQDNGTRKGYIFASAQMTATSRCSVAGIVIGPDGQIREDEPKEHSIIRYLRLAEKNGSAADAMRFYRKGDWVSLYKVFEIIRNDCNSKKENRDWFKNSEVKRFTHTADNEKAIGDDARHAATNNPPPAKPMTIGEASRLSIMKY